MRRPTFSLLAIALGALLFASSAQASFGLDEFDVTFTTNNGSSVAQAGTHPFAMTTSLHFNSEVTPEGGELLDEAAKDIIVFQIPGFVGAPTVVPTCQSADFLTIFVDDKNGEGFPGCPDSTAIGVTSATLSNDKAAGDFYGAVYNLEPPPGKAARIGFWIAGVPVPIELSVEESPPYRVVGGPTNISQVVEVVGAELTLWGVPADPAHDSLRGHCFSSLTGTSLGICPSGLSERPFLTMPRACRGPLETVYAADPWAHPGALLPNGLPDLSDPNWVTGSSPIRDAAGNPVGFTGCGKLGFNPSVTAQPTTRAAESPTGLDFSLDVDNEGLENPSEDAIADADIEKAVVTLPEGMTANPSSAEGLEVCSEAQLAREDAFSAPGQGCPDASKLGTIEVQTPLLDETVGGSLYLAEPYENPYGSLLALYIVLQNRELGISIKLPAKVEPDPRTGRLVTTTEDLPELPFSHFKLHFREGARSPLVSPPACGRYEVEAELTPSSGGDPLTTTSAFQIVSGPNESPCPAGGTPPFRPGFEAGANNNSAGAFSPFYMRLTRRDGDQDLTKFSAKLPPGMVAKLAGTDQCPEAAIARARSRTGQDGGREERRDPSCPASSQIGRVLAGAGVGGVLTYVPGSLYLSGPYKGAPLSVVAIVPALAGPFDAGTVVIREALRINPLSAEVEADGSSSDPIPHILKGIPLKVRDVRVYVDKPSFTLNPTSCAPSQIGATLWSGGIDLFDTFDDSAHSLASRFQAADCASLGFKPSLSFKLKGGNKRGDHPALIGTYVPRGGDANLKSLVLRLPRSAFLDQAHIRTICTRVQFAAKSCPAAAIYGQATAYTPLLDQPLSGPVYLRSSNHKLPDFVADLHGTIDVEAVARIDSVRGGIRATFPQVPDAPLSKVVVRMQGANKGLIVNSRDLCVKPSRASVQFAGHNGRRANVKPAMRADCAKAGKRGRKR